MRNVACRASFVTPRENPERERTGRTHHPCRELILHRAIQAKADWSCNHGGCNDRVCLFCCLQNTSIMIVIVYKNKDISVKDEVC